MPAVPKVMKAGDIICIYVVYIVYCIHTGWKGIDACDQITAGSFLPFLQDVHVPSQFPIFTLLDGATGIN